MKKLLIVPFVLMLLIASAFGAVLSVESPSITNHPELGKVWKLTLTGGSQPENIWYGNADTLKSTDAGVPVTPRYDFELKSSIEEEFCEYPLTAQNTKDIYTYKVNTYADIAGWDVGKTYNEKCGKAGEIAAYTVKGGLFDKPDLICIYRELKAAGGQVGTGRIHFKTKFTLQREGSILETYVLATDGVAESELQKSIPLGSNGVLAWTGYGLSSPSTCPVATTNFAFQESITNQWKVGVLDNLNKYQAQRILVDDKLNELDNTFSQDCILGIICTDISPLIHQNTIDAVNKMNTMAFNAMGATTQIEGKTITTSGQNAKMSLSRDFMLFDPVFLLYLKADYLQIIPQVGNPKIALASFVECNEGITDQNRNKVTVSVYNDGLGESLTQAKITCGSGIRMVESNKQIRLGPKGSANAAGTLDFPFTIDIATDLDMSCSVTVYDSVWPSNKDGPKEASTKCIAKVFCDQSYQECVGTALYVCKNGQKVIDSAAKKCLPEICNDKIDNNENGQVDEGCVSPSCNNNKACEPLKGENNLNCADCQTGVCDRDGICEGPFENGFNCAKPTGDCNPICDNDGKCEIFSGENFEQCGGKANGANDCATCNSDKVCDATETETSCAVDCVVAPDMNWLWIVGGAAGAGILALVVFKYMPKKKGRGR